MNIIVAINDGTKDKGGGDIDNAYNTTKEGVHLKGNVEDIVDKCSGENYMIDIDRKSNDSTFDDDIKNVTVTVEGRIEGNSDNVNVYDTIESNAEKAKKNAQCLLFFLKVKKQRLVLLLIF